MPILQSEMKAMKSATVDDSGANGGRMTAVQVDSSYFPDITGSERGTGLSRYRKEFIKNVNKNAVSGVVNLSLLNARAFMKKITPGDDYFRLFAEQTDADTQTEAAAFTAEEWAGAAILDSDITAGATSISIEAEVVDGSAHGGFSPNSQIRISDGSKTEYLTLTADAISYVGNVATLNLTTSVVNNFSRAKFSHTADIFSSTTIGNTAANFGSANALVGDLVKIVSGTGIGQVRRISASTTTTATISYPWLTTPDGTSQFIIIGTYVSKVVDLGTIVATWTDNSDVANQFTKDDPLHYDEATNPLLLFPEGTVDDVWTLTIGDNGTTFSVAGAATGALASGTIGVTYKPANGASYLFELAGAGWGTVATDGSDDGQTIVFKTKHSAKGLWIKQIVPAGSNPHGDNRALIGFGGDTI